MGTAEGHPQPGGTPTCPIADRMQAVCMVVQPLSRSHRLSRDEDDVSSTQPRGGVALSLPA